MVTGSCGQLGGHVTRLLLARDVTVLGLSRRPCTGSHGEVRVADVCDSARLTDVLESFQPTHIAHLAAVSSPAGAERDQERAWALNLTVPRQLARTGAWLFYPSTDFVWDGTKNGRYRDTDVPEPRSLYGEMKVAGERVVGRSGLVARLSLLHGLPVCPRETTWTRWHENLSQGKEITVCDDEFRTPLELSEAAKAIVDLGSKNVRGLIHLAGPDVLTPRDMARRLAGSLAVKPKLRPVSRLDLPGGKARPRNVAMAPTVMFGVVIPAYNGAHCLHRSMVSLARQRFDGRLRVVVAVNDGREDTAEEARRLAPVIRATGAECSVVVSSPKRANAFAAAEAELPEGPRLYLDQDAVLSPNTVAELARILRPGSGIHFAAPRPRAVRPHSVVSRAFYRAWQDLPYVRESPVTMGAYAVSAEGRRRWDAFPDVHSDDKWVRWHFASHERAVLRDGTYEIVLPEGVRELVRARRRYQSGNRELQCHDLEYADDDRRHRGVVRSLVSRPTRWPCSAVFLGVYSAAAVLDRYAE